MRDGFPAGYVAFAAIVIPLAGIFLFRRMWMLSRRYGYITQGEMFADYFQDNVLRIATWLISLLFAVPFLGLMLGASGFLVEIATGGLVPRDMAMWALATLLLIYTTAGGIRAIAHVSTLHTLLLFLGILLLGLFALDLVGGFEMLNRALARIASYTSGEWTTTQGLGGGDYNPLFALAGVVQWTGGLGWEHPVGSLWTGAMAVTFVAGFMGVICSPAFALWSYAASSPTFFAPQQLWGSAVGVGLLFVFFVVAMGSAGLLLGANGEVNAAGLAVSQVLPMLSHGDYGRLVPELIGLMGKASPWLYGLVAVCAIAMMKAAGGIFLLGFGAATSRDIYKRFVNPAATDRQQKVCARISMLVAAGLAIAVALFAPRGMTVTGEIAMSLSLQLLPALLAVAWVPWFDRKAITAGLIVGALVAIFTDTLGILLADGFLPWGRWPWTIHSSAWGLAANFAVCIIGSAAATADNEKEHCRKFHAFIASHAALPDSKKGYVSLAWITTIGWVFFGIGPGAVIGNFAFGNPQAGYEGWQLGMPSIWGWQLIWWALGCLLIWFLAYKMELSGPLRKEVYPLKSDSHEGQPAGLAPF